MSYRISYSLLAVRLPIEEYGEPLYVMCELAGDNNCYESPYLRFGRTHARRSRHWSVVGIGREYQLLSKACWYGQDCPGGMMRLASDGRNYTEPEAYIRAWRRAMENAIDLNEAAHAGIMHLNFRIRIDTGASGEYATTRDSLIGSGRPFEHHEERIYTTVYQYDIWKFQQTPEDLTEWFKVIYRLAPWHCVEASSSTDDGPKMAALVKKYHAWKAASAKENAQALQTVEA